MNDQSSRRPSRWHLSLCLFGVGLLSPTLAVADGIATTISREPWKAVVGGGFGAGGTVVGSGETADLACNDAMSNTLSTSGLCQPSGVKPTYRNTVSLSAVNNYCYIESNCPENGSTWYFIHTYYLTPPTETSCPRNSIPERSEFRPSSQPPDICVCSEGFAPFSGSCYPVVTQDDTLAGDACSAVGNPNPYFGKPLSPLTGREKYSIDLGLRVGWAPVSLTYNTGRRAPLVPISRFGIGTDKPSFDFFSLGDLWSLSPHSRLELDFDFAVSTIADKGTIAKVVRGDGSIVNFRFSPGAPGEYENTAGGTDRLIRSGNNYWYFDDAARTVSSFSSSGQLTRVDSADGKRMTFAYAAGGNPSDPPEGFPLHITDNFGRSLTFTYTGRKLTGAIDSSGAQVSFGFDSATDSLTSIRLPDAALRQLLYERNGIPWALTGVIDEQNKRFASIGYDEFGNANLSRLAGGANAYSVIWGFGPRVYVADEFYQNRNVIVRRRSWRIPSDTVLTLPNGESSALGVMPIHGSPHLTSMSQAAGSGCGASRKATEYDSRGNAVQVDDFNNNRTCVAYDEKNRESVRVEGLSPSQNCSQVTAQGSALPPGSRKISRTWHPVWRLEVKRAEPGRIITSVYNGQPDPFAGGGDTVCVEGNPGLVNGSPVAALCEPVLNFVCEA